MRGTRAVLVLVSALAVLAVAGPVAGAQAAFDLSAPGQDASAPQVAVDPDGNAHYTWQRSNGTNQIVQARTVAADGTLGTVQDLSAAGQDARDQQVAVDGDGNAHYTWDRYDGTDQIVQARTVAADGTPGTVQDLSVSTAGHAAYAPQVAVDSDGNAHYTWYRYDGTNQIVQARTVAADGTPGTVQDLSAAGQDAYSPQVAVDSAGDAHYTWYRNDVTNNYIVQARTVSADGTPGTVQDLSATGQGAFGQEVAADSAGNAHYTWQRSNGTTYIVQARTVSADGTPGTVQDLSAPGQTAFNPQVAVDADGNAHYTWYRWNGTNYIVQARTVAADGTPGTVQDLSATGKNAYSPQVAIDPDGNAHYTWQRYDGTNYIVQARTVAADGTLGTVQDLSAAGQDARDQQVAVDGDGNAHYTWDRYDGTHSIVQGATVAAPDTTAPSASIGSGPSGTTNSNDPSFGFSSEAGATFECKLDGPGAATGSYTSCTSPKAYSNLADGSYTFSVKATDQANNTGDAATRTFTVDTTVPDTTPPETSIDSGPSGTTSSNDPAFGFSSEAGATFECKLDGPGAATGSYSSCTNPKGYTDLADGSYTFSVRATDTANNTDQTPATRSFAVDTSAKPEPRPNPKPKPKPPVPDSRCGEAAGSVHGRTLGAAVLGRTRSAVRKRFPGFLRPRNGVDRFCFTEGGLLRVGYLSHNKLSKIASHPHGGSRAVLILTTSRHYIVRGVRPGAAVSDLHRALRHARKVRVGSNRWYVLRGEKAEVLVKTRHGRVGEIGIAVKQPFHTRRAAKRFLASFPLR